MQVETSLPIEATSDRSDNASTDTFVGTRESDESVPGKTRKTNFRIILNAFK